MATLKRKSPEFADPTDVTPTGPPAKRMRLTQSQKQALIDNLQLEITERARKLRSQYALQANDLRSRIERRVNRIPVSLRKVTMGELFDKHSGLFKTSPMRKASPVKAFRAPPSISIDQALSPARENRSRRTSHDDHYSDKENAPATGEPEGLKNPKRRGKAPAAGSASRVASQEVRANDNRILSPKSLNSRTYPQSPFRASPEKGQPSYLSRPTSPLKPSSPLRAGGPSSRPRGTTISTVRDNYPSSQTKKSTSRAATGPRPVRSPLPRPATRQGIERKNSMSSTASSGTTVQKPTRTGTNARKATTGTASSTAKKAATARPQAASMAVKKTATASTVRKTTAPASTTEAATRTRALRKRI
ncbi:hypothetical protein N7523_001025 [Penicillium sp. IBT 18751x]|nr:hypothetical protein N7523_001025 [Penicillium sp. IBT 18751x]